MLYKIFLNIKSEYPSEAFYQIFAASDTDNKIPLDGMEGWLDSKNSMVEIEVKAKHKQLKIGFKKQASIFGDWIAHPLLIDTSESIVFTTKGEITQVDAALLQMGRITKTSLIDHRLLRLGGNGVGKLAGGIIGSLAKNSSLTKDVKGLISGIPYAGIITALANVIWPDPSVSSLINGAELRMRNLIITQIRQMNLASQKGSLGAIRNNLREYQNARGSSRRIWLENTLSSFNLVKSNILNKHNDYTPGSVYIALDLAGLHLGMLRERINYEKEIFGDEDVNTEFNIKILTETVKEYQEFLDFACKEEIKERLSQISISYKNSTGLGPRGILGEALMIRIFVRDNVRRQIHRFSVEGSFNETIVNVPDAKQIEDAQFLVDMYLAQVKNELDLRLENDIRIPSQMLDWFIPGKENTKPVSMDKVFVGGPFTGLLQRDFNHPRIKNIDFISNKPATLKYVEIERRRKSIAPNFGYDDGKGGMRFSEGHKVKDPHFVLFKKNLDTGVYLNKIESWWNELTIAMRLTFSDDTTSGIIGETNGGEYQCIEMNHMGLSQDFVGANDEARKYGFRLMSTFYDL